MLNAITGPQGSGKTTILTELAHRGYNVIERKTSRSILNDWNMTLSDIYSDPIIMREFQAELIIRKQEDEADKIESDEIWFTDRSYVDLLAYTGIILGHDDNNKEWLDEYYLKCSKLQKLYSKVFYIPPLPFVTSDGVRGSSLIYNEIVDSVIKRFMYTCKKNCTQIEEIKSIDNKYRVNEILKKL